MVAECHPKGRVYRWFRRNICGAQSWPDICWRRRRNADDQQEFREKIFQLLFKQLAVQSDEVVEVAKKGLQVSLVLIASAGQDPPCVHAM